MVQFVAVGSVWGVVVAGARSVCVCVCVCVCVEAVGEVGGQRGAACCEDGCIEGSTDG